MFRYKIEELIHFCNAEKRNAFEKSNFACNKKF